MRSCAAGGIVGTALPARGRRTPGCANGKRGRLRRTVTVEASVLTRVDTGLTALCAIAGYYRIPGDPISFARELALEKPAEAPQILRAASRLGLKAKVVAMKDIKRLTSAPMPAIV